MSDTLSHRAVVFRAAAMFLTVIAIAGAIGAVIGHQLGTNTTSIALSLLIGVVLGSVGGNIIALWALDHWE